jgi:hypothetical protein
MSSPAPPNARPPRSLLVTVVDVVTRPIGFLHVRGGSVIVITVSLIASLCFALSELVVRLALSSRDCWPITPGNPACHLSPALTLLVKFPWGPILATSWTASGVVGAAAALRTRFVRPMSNVHVVHRGLTDRDQCVPPLSPDAPAVARDSKPITAAEVAAAAAVLMEATASACDAIDAMRNVGLVPPLPLSRERRHEVAVHLLLGSLVTKAIDRALIDESSLRACAWEVVRHLETALTTVPTSHRVWPWR